MPRKFPSVGQPKISCPHAQSNHRSSKKLFFTGCADSTSLDSGIARPYAYKQTVPCSFLLATKPLTADAERYFHGLYFSL
jgi:hypothetical protein